jgi:hypothetical protein
VVADVIRAHRQQHARHVLEAEPCLYDCFWRLLRMADVISTIVVGIAFMLWAFLVFLLGRASCLNLRSRSWPTTKGTVKLSKVEVVGNHHRELLQYEYTVNGVSYVSHIISFIDLFLLVFMNGKRSRRAAEHIVAKYPLGSEVTVHFEKNNPKRAVLETQIWNINVAIILVILIIAGGLFLCGLWSNSIIAL